jgi:hypothetical protein
MIALLLLLLVIPAQPLSGQVGGKPFALSSACFARETLVLTGQDGLQVRIWAPWTDVPEGLTFTGDSSSRVWDAPVVEVARGDDLHGTYDPTSGYEVRLEFATVVNGQLPTRLALRLPDGSLLGGELSVKVEYPR